MKASRLTDTDKINLSIRRKYEIKKSR